MLVKYSPRKEGFHHERASGKIVSQTKRILAYITPKKTDEKRICGRRSRLSNTMRKLPIKRDGRRVVMIF